MRINKFIASCGVSSRRKSEELISSGDIQVNGKVVSDLAFQVDEKKDVVTLHGKQICIEEKKEYYIVNKPKGVISASFSKYKEKTVADLVVSKARLFPVGRLDKDTTGLIILTNDGEVAYRLTHPKFEQPKTYEALVKGNVTSQELDKLKKGVVLEGRRTLPAKCRLLGKQKGDSLVEITLREGKKRQVKNMMLEIGHRVIELKRTKEGFLCIEDLKEGEYRALSQREIKTLRGEGK